MRRWPGSGPERYALAGLGLAGILGALALLGCVQRTTTLPPAPVAVGPAITIDTAPVQEFETTEQGMQTLRVCADKGCDGFTWAGGLNLTSRQTSRLHGLSDLQVWPDGRLLVQGDQGDQLEARLLLDARGRLVGLKDARLIALKGPDGADLYSAGDRMRDAEGIAEFANGDRLVTFEQTDRALLYPKAGGPPRPAPIPAVTYVFNKGLEALAPYPAAGPDAYLAGVEATGQVFLCRLSTSCAPHAQVDLGGDSYELVALEPLPDGRMAYLLRAFDPLRGARIALRIVDVQNRRFDELVLARPMTVDNFEGVAAVPQRGGAIRFYLISDDNFSNSQRTLLMAFDWTPPQPR